MVDDFATLKKECDIFSNASIENNDSLEFDDGAL